MTTFQKSDGSFVLGEQDIINKRQLAEKLQVSTQTIQRWQRQGMPVIQFSNFNGYEVDKVMQWLKEHGYSNYELMAKWRAESQWGRGNITRKKEGI